MTAQLAWGSAQPSSALSKLRHVPWHLHAPVCSLETGQCSCARQLPPRSLLHLACEPSWPREAPQFVRSEHWKKFCTVLPGLMSCTSREMNFPVDCDPSDKYYKWQISLKDLSPLPNIVHVELAFTFFKASLILWALIDSTRNSNVQLQSSSTLPSQCCILHSGYRSDPDEICALRVHSLVT